MAPRWLTRCTTMAKPGVGTIHLHRRLWRPGTLTEMWFQPEGRAVMHPVPEPVWEQALSAESMEQVMALVRRERSTAAD